MITLKEPTWDSRSRLPEGYTEVEYIQSDENSYINTGYRAKNYTKAKVVYKCISNVAWNNIFGTYGGSSVSAGKFFMLSTQTNGGQLYTHFANQSIGNITASATDEHTVILDGVNSKITIDGTDYSYGTTSSFVADYDFLLFTVTAYGGGLADIRAPKQISVAEIYENGTLIHNYVPCINPSNVVGMYDLISETFFGNSGSGSFIAGEPV